MDIMLSQESNNTKCSQSNSPSLSSDSAVHSPASNSNEPASMEYTDGNRKTVSPSLSSSNKRCYSEDNDQSDDGIEIERSSPPAKQMSLECALEALDSFRANSENSENKFSPNSSFGYRGELKRPDLKGTFRCTICQKIFCHSSSLSRHRMQAHFKSFRCTICNQDVSNNETLRAHMYKQHQISRMFMCKCCNWAFPDKTSLHMHVQAKEEGKAISVPVIGKGNPPSTSTLQNATSHLLGLSNHQTNVNINSTLPSSSSFNSLHGLSNLSASLPLQQAFGLGDQNLFPQLQMMQNSNNNDLINKVKDNIFLTSLMPNLGLQNWFAAAMSAASSQSGFNLSNVENTMNQPIDMEKVFATLHSLEEQNGQDNLSTLETMASNKKNSERDQNGMADTSSSNSSTNSSPAPITMEKNSAKTFFKHEEMGNDIPLNISADDNSHTQQSAQCSGVSPSETNSSISPSTDNGSSTGCYDCGMQKSKFAVVENRCRYLEERMSTLQAETLRYSTRLTVAESSCRQVESDLRSQREQNELLQKKLLECQEKSLAFMQSVDYQSSSSINALLNELIKSTIFQ
uniref:C2H2-type domain-containing protein n=1 Tax=Rhabditophanes sp. KR3021 TaxID=114890 RepID=A0AC35TM81_9BILA